jgi:hypothetical protein
MLTVTLMLMLMLTVMLTVTLMLMLMLMLMLTLMLLLSARWLCVAVRVYQCLETADSTPFIGGLAHVQLWSIAFTEDMALLQALDPTALVMNADYGGNRHLALHLGDIVRDDRVFVWKDRSVYGNSATFETYNAPPLSCPPVTFVAAYGASS